MQNLKSILYMTAGVLFGLFIAVLVWVVARNPSGQAVTLRPVPTEKPIVVQVSGAVPRPGVYALAQGSRVQDAISAAGGFLAEADKTGINLARALADGEQLDIPYLSGNSPVILDATTTVTSVATALSSTELININTASVSELDSLPGIGPTTAQKIIDYRQQNGPFVSTADIINVSGVGPGTYEKIKNLITVGP
jgi:competence protein ComEA